MHRNLQHSWARFFIVSQLLLVISCRVQEPIRIGFVANLTGQNAALGVDGRDGALLAIEQINAAGGVNGRPLELVIRDDLGTPEGAIAADGELIRNERVPVIVGHMTSNTMMAAWPEYGESGVIFLSPTVSTPQLSGIDDRFFRLIPVNSAFSKQLAEYVSNELRLRRAAILYDTDNAAFTRTFRDGFASNFVLMGGEVVMDYAFSAASAPDFKPVLTRLKEQQPDVICIVASAVDTALIAQQSRLVGLDARFVTANWALTDDLIENGGRAVDGIITVTAHNETSQSPAYLAFAAQFQSRFGRRPTFAAGYGYEAILVLAAAFRQVDNGQDLLDAIQQTEALPGVDGTISFDPYGDVVRTLYLIAVRDGQFVTEKTFPIPQVP